jgi:hypothetical protein
MVLARELPQETAFILSLFESASEYLSSGSLTFLNKYFTIRSTTSVNEGCDEHKTTTVKSRN